jgi:hypothetical protein
MRRVFRSGLGGFKSWACFSGPLCKTAPANSRQISDRPGLVLSPPRLVGNGLNFQPYLCSCFVAHGFRSALSPSSSFSVPRRWVSWGHALDFIIASWANGYSKHDFVRLFFYGACFLENSLHLELAFVFECLLQII